MTVKFAECLLLAGLLLAPVGVQAQDVQIRHGRADGGSEAEARAKAKIEAFEQLRAFGSVDIVSEGEGKCDSYGGTSWTCEYDISFQRRSNASLRLGN